jgi:hypothetical protein
MDYVGTGVWALGKNALRNGTASVPTYKWFYPYSSTYVFTLQPAKNSEAGKMHMMAAYGDNNLLYVYATGTARLNNSPPSSPTLAATQYPSSGIAVPYPPSPVTQGNGDVLTGSDGRMQMCTQAGAQPATNALLFCTLDISCQMGGATTSCM